MVPCRRMTGRNMVRSLLITLDQQATGPVKAGGSIPGECLLKWRRLITRGQAPFGEPGREVRLHSVSPTCGVWMFKRPISPRYRSRLCMGSSHSNSNGNDPECYRFHSSFSASGAQQGLLSTNSEIVPFRLHGDMSKRSARCRFAPRSERGSGQKCPAHHDALGRSATFPNSRRAAIAPFPSSDEGRGKCPARSPAWTRHRTIKALSGSACPFEMVLAVASNRLSYSMAIIAAGRRAPVNLGWR